MARTLLSQAAPLAIALLLCVAPALAADLPLSGDIMLRLPNGVWREKPGEGGPTEPCELMLSLSAKEGRFQPEVLGAGVAFTRSYHEGKVSTSAIQGNQITLDLDMEIHTDWSIKGGKGHYHLVLSRNGRDLTGRYEGVYRGKAVSGEVTGIVPQALSGQAPAAAGEHPRLLFRQADADALRAAARTPQGQAIVTALEGTLSQRADEDPGNHAAGHALLYCLRGEPREAESARVLVRYTLDRFLANAQSPAVARQMMGVALAYDLCYSGWDQPTRWSVARALQRRADQLLDFGERHSTGYDSAPASAWQGRVRSAAGFCGLAVLQDALGPFDSFGERILNTVDTPAAFTPGRGVRVNPIRFQSFVSQDWLYAGPFPRVGADPFGDGPEERDHLQSVGGRTNPTPSIEVGTQVTSAGVTRRFQKVPPECVQADNNGHLRLDFPPVTGQVDDAVWYFYTVVQNDRTRHARLWELYNDAPSVWIGGQRTRDNQPLTLAPGFIPILAELRVGQHPTYLSMGFYFHEVSETENQSFVKYVIEERARGTPTTEPRLARTIRLSRLQVLRFLAADSPDAQSVRECAIPFLIAYRNTLAFDTVTAEPALSPAASPRVQEAIVQLLALRPGAAGAPEGQPAKP